MMKMVKQAVNQRSQPVRKAKAKKDLNYSYPSFLIDSIDEEKSNSKKKGKSKKKQRRSEPLANVTPKPPTPVRVNDTQNTTDCTLTNTPRNLSSLLGPSTIPETQGMLSPIIGTPLSSLRTTGSISGSADLGIHTLVTSSMLPTAVSTPIDRKLADNERQLVQARHQIRETTAKVETLKEENKTIKVQLSIKEEEIQSLRERDYAKENKTLREKVSKIDSELKALKNIKKQSGKKVNELDDAKKEIHKLRDKIAELESVLSALQKTDHVEPNVETQNRFTPLTEAPALNRSYAKVASAPPTADTMHTSDSIYYFRSFADKLSNFHADPVHYRGKSYKTAEHCYQYAMAAHHDNMAAANNIARAETPGEAKRLAHTYIPNCRSSWETSKVSVMEEIIESKAQQHPSFRAALLSTGNKKLIHNMERDAEWGFGRDGKGLNLMGRVLEKQRTKIQADMAASVTQPVVRPKVVNSSAHPDKSTSVQPTSHSASTTPNNARNKALNTNVRPGAYMKKPGDTREKPSLFIIGNSNARNLAQRMKSKPAVDTSSLCYSGAPTGYIASRGPHIKISEQPSHVLIHTGDIDVRSRRSPEQNAMDMDNMLHMVSKAFPLSKILVSTIPEVRNPAINHKIKDLNQFVRFQCDRHNHLTQVGSGRIPLRRDNIHISNKGLDMLSMQVADIITNQYL